MSAGGSGRPKERGDVGRGIDPCEWLVEALANSSCMAGFIWLKWQNSNLALRQADFEVVSATSIYSDFGKRGRFQPGKSLASR